MRQTLRGNPNNPKFREAQQACQSIMRDALPEGARFGGGPAGPPPSGSAPRRRATADAPPPHRRIALVAAGALGRRSAGRRRGALWTRRASADEGEAAPAATATAERRDLVASEDVTGALGYADARSLAEHVQRHRHGPARPGLDAAPRRDPLRGSTPPHRPALRHAAGVPRAVRRRRGPRRRQLERNLVALGYDPDDDMTRRRRLRLGHRGRRQALAGGPRPASETGIVELGDVVFLPGPRRVGKRRRPRSAAAPAASS